MKLRSVLLYSNSVNQPSLCCVLPFLVLYSFGETPVVFLNLYIKFDIEPNPEPKHASETEKPLESIVFA